MHETKDYCGIVAITGHPDAVEKTYLGLFALQHRGQESAGIASTDGTSIKCHAEMGLVRDAMKPPKRRWLTNPTVIGHVRYSTTGTSSLKNCQPLIAEYSRGQIAIAHNGNLTNAGLLRDEYEAYGSIFTTTSDTEIIVHLLAKPTHIAKPDPLGHVMNHLEGAFSLLVLTPEEVIAIRDPQGMRPLCLGRCGDSYVVASETCALNIMGAKYEREIYPGEILHIRASGLKSELFCSRSRVKPAHCIFEHIYIARPDSMVFGESVHGVRRRLGRRLAKEHPVEADVVFPIPDTGRGAAIGFSQASETPLDMGFIRSHYAGRSFIEPSQAMREDIVKLKLAVVPETVAGKRVVAVEDSIVRGTTTRGKMQALRDAGAKEVHLRVSAPPLRWPCFYGVDFPTREELIASDRTEDEVCEYLGVDSLGYMSLDGLLSCVSQPPDNYCTACFTGNYPVPIYPESRRFIESRQLKIWEDT